jgi:hypothetical protein
MFQPEITAFPTPTKTMPYLSANNFQGELNFVKYFRIPLPDAPAYSTASLDRRSVDASERDSFG